MEVVHIEQLLDRYGGRCAENAPEGSRDAAEDVEMCDDSRGMLIYSKSLSYGKVVMV